MRVLGTCGTRWEDFMLANKYSVVQIVAKLREHEKLPHQGLTILQACKRLGISGQTCWKFSTTVHTERALDAMEMAIWSRRTTELKGLSEVAPQYAVVEAEHRRVLGVLKARQTDWIAVYQPASATKLPVERCPWPSAHPLRTGQPSPPPT